MTGPDRVFHVVMTWLGALALITGAAVLIYLVVSLVRAEKF